MPSIIDIPTGENETFPTRLFPGHYGTPGHRLRHGDRDFGLGGVTAEGKCRRVYQGPELPGPYAYTFALGTMIAAHPIADDNVYHDVEAGDILHLEGTHYVVSIEQRGEFITLRPISDVVVEAIRWAENNLALYDIVVPRAVAQWERGDTDDASPVGWIGGQIRNELPWELDERLTVDNALGNSDPTGEIGAYFYWMTNPTKGA